MENTLFILDIDGTLTESCKTHQETYYQACLEFFGQKEIDISDWDKVEHYTDSCFFVHACKQLNYCDITEDNFKIFEKKCLDIFKTKYEGKEILGAGDFIKELRAKNIPFVIATGSTRSLAIHKLKEFEIDESLIIGSKLKYISRESVLEQAINKAKEHYNKEEFTRIISLGDGLWDYQTAKNMNLEFIAIGDKLHENPMGDSSVKLHLNYKTLNLNTIL